MPGINDRPDPQDVDMPPVYKYRLDCQMRYSDGTELSFQIDLIAPRLPVVGESIAVWAGHVRRARIIDILHDPRGPYHHLVRLEPIPGIGRQALIEAINLNPELNSLVDQVS